jgi:hypothetical protein
MRRAPSTRTARTTRRRTNMKKTKKKKKKKKKYYGDPVDLRCADLGDHRV